MQCHRANHMFTSALELFQMRTLRHMNPIVYTAIGSQQLLRNRVTVRDHNNLIDIILLVTYTGEKPSYSLVVKCVLKMVRFSESL